MDINRTSRALHALNISYQYYYHMLGVSDGVFATGGKKWRHWGFRYRRSAIKKKLISLIEHDRVLTGRRSWFL